MDNLELNFKFTVAEANIIAAGLGKLPLEAGIGVYEKLKAQAEPQLKVAAPAASEAPASE
jgi:hypothetical protein